MIINIKNLEINDDTYQQIINLYNNFTEINKKEFTIEKLKKFISDINNNHKIFLFLIDNTIVGAITIILEQKIIHDGKSVCHIEDFVILENYRKTDIGELLINFSINLAKKNNCYKCILNCHEYLKNYYIKQGFINKELCMVKYFDNII